MNNPTRILATLAIIVPLSFFPKRGLADEGTNSPIYKNQTATIDARVDDLMKRMTLEEKIEQLENRPSGNSSDIDTIFQGKSYGCTHEMNMPASDCAAMYQNLQAYMLTKTRLGIPIITAAEGIEGILQNNCTIFPQALAQGSTFNPDLIEQMTGAAGQEAKVIGIHQILSPVLDIARELRWGRIEETFGEDPYLISKMGIAFVTGYQKYQLTCTPKHFVAHGSPAGGLNCAGVEGGERELQSLYLYPFRNVIQATHPLSVMSCYSAYDGEAVTGSRRYMTDILRGELGFSGYVYSDWGSIERLLTFHHVVQTREEAAKKALMAGVDLDIDSCYELLEKMVQDGSLDPAYIDVAVRRILTVKFALGLFENPFGDPSKVGEVVRNAAHVALSKKVAEESAVLLENKNHILPLDLSRYKSIAVVGPNSDFAVFGDYSWAGRDSSQGVSLFKGLQTVIGDKTVLTQADGCDWWSQNTNDIARAVNLVMKSDLAIVAIGTRSTYLGRSPEDSTAGEGFDLSSLELPGIQNAFLKAIKATGKPVIVVFISGKPLAIPWVKDNADAVLVQWYGGEQQGTALAEIITGMVNPSGRLNISFPRSTGDTPCFYNHPVTDRDEPFDQPGSPEQPGGHYIFEKPDALWMFGEGMSYTEFQYKDCQLNASHFHARDTLKATVQVQNTGTRDGAEVVQLYIHYKTSSVATPQQELKAFKKQSIAAGSSEYVTLEMPISELTVYNDAMKPVVEAGQVEIEIGSSPRNIIFTKTIEIE